jgi:hypothetical protein
MNKLSLVGMQLPENIRRISTFRAKALRLEFLVKTSKFSLYFSGSYIPTNESLFMSLALPNTGTDSSGLYGWYVDVYKLSGKSQAWFFPQPLPAGSRERLCLIIRQYSLNKTNNIRLVTVSSIYKSGLWEKHIYIVTFWQLKDKLMKSYMQCETIVNRQILYDIFKNARFDRREPLVKKVIWKTKLSSITCSKINLFQPEPIVC